MSCTSLTIKPAVASRRPLFVEEMLLSFLLFSSLISATLQTPPVQIHQNIQAFLDARQYTQAEQALERQLERSPNWDVGHLLLAQIYNLTARYDLAERSGLSAIRLRESLDGFMLLAVVTMHLKKLNESIEWLEKAAQRRPDYPEIYRLLGLDYALGGMLKESEKAFRRAVELEPKNWESHYLHGRVLYELEEHQNSQKALRRAMELNPASEKPWTALGQVQEKLHDAVAAEMSYQKALELCDKQTSERSWPLLQLGLLTERQKGAQEAEQYFRKAVAARPDWAKPHFYLGKALIALGDINGALAEMETAVRLDEGKSQYHYQLAQVYRRMRETEKARQQMARYQVLADLERKKGAAAEFIDP
jgi:tetratricopeptide (TPR) repeat protein